MRGSHGSASTKGIQKGVLTLHFKDNVHLKVPSDLDNKIEEILIDAMTKSLTGKYDLNEIYFDDLPLFEGKIDSDLIYDLDFTVETTIYGSFDYDPGVHTYSNGDPGYPPSMDWEPDYGWVEGVDRNILIGILGKIKNFGDKLDLDKITVTIGDPEESSDLEIEESFPDYF